MSTNIHNNICASLLFCFLKFSFLYYVVQTICLVAIRKPLSMEDRTLLTFVLFSASGKALYKNSALLLLLLIRLEGIMSFSRCQSILGQKLRGEILPFSMTMTQKHTSESTKEWIYQNKIRVLEWSSLSLGLNSIQHPWI